MKIQKKKKFQHSEPPGPEIKVLLASESFRLLVNFVLFSADDEEWVVFPDCEFVFAPMSPSSGK